ncbi:MAG: carboxypeptidase-like regulatory domain-containing protein, partial [Flavobacterium sp.]|nr:carboxypeptidase-like regulatory domain-containing protein [Pedobacter sp.]
MKIFTFLFLIISFQIQAQVKDSLVTGTFNNLQMNEFVTQLESQTSYHFYYKSADFDSLKINFSVTDQALPAVLTMAFKGSSFKFAIDGEHVFLSSNKTIKTELPADFFASASSSPQIEKEEVEMAANTEVKTIRATLENKLYTIGRKSGNLSGTATLSGSVRNIKSGEPVAGSSVYIEKPRIGTSTDQYGYYSITIPKGSNVLHIKGAGMKERKHQIIIYGDGKLNVELQDQVFALKEVVISAERAANVTRVQLGVEKLTIQNIKQIPAVFGEADIIKAVLTLPGVKSVGEASSGFNVRGGSTDQNLILFNDATIYNPAHFFGFFSAFNPEVVKDITLYKSSIPSKYGGRLSSVLDISTREGNKKKFSGSAGIGLLTSRLNIEGPLIKDRTSVIIGGRTTYSNWLLDLLPKQYNNSRASFYDLNLGINH